MNQSFDTKDRADFVKALRATMPFGQHKGKKLMDLPGHYLAWFSRQGFPNGLLGKQMALVYELDHNGLLSELRMKLKNK